MKNFKTKIGKLCKIKFELDDHIWDVFDAYIKQEKILFSSPDEWFVDEDDINFTGSDGCMGCYDSKSISIPISFFVNPTAELLRLKKERNSKEKEAQKRAEKTTNQRDRREFERLKKKFK